jgi:stress response protein SCP2/predicted type IV restriction endonuclease
MDKLVKGQNFIISESKISIDFRWSNLKDKQIDVLVFQLSNDRIEDERDFIYFNNLKSEGVSLSLNSNSTKIDFDLSNLRENINKVLIVTTIDGKFGELSDFSLKINDKVFEIEGGVENTLNVAEIYNRNGKWKFKAIGDGYISGLEKIAERCGLDLSSLSKEERQKRFRRSSKDVVSEHMSKIKTELEKFKPNIDSAVLGKYNESDTRMVIDKIFIDALGYKIDEVKTEQRIQGRKADYILSVDGVNHIVVEAKKAGMQLREKQIFQATSYGAYSGIKWALLTNLIDWQLYYVNSGDMIEPELVFSITLDTIAKEDLEHLFSISRFGLTRKGLLTKTLERNRTLSQSNIISVILTDDVISKVRTTVNKNSSYKTSNDEIQNVLEELLNM